MHQVLVRQPDDRYDQRQLMIGADVVESCACGIALPLMPSLWMMYGIMFLCQHVAHPYSCLSQVYITRLVPAERREAIQFLQARISSGAFIYRPGHSRSHVDLSVPAAAIYANAASFVVPALILMLLPGWVPESRAA